MITIKYFASLREQLNCDVEQLHWQTSVSTLFQIKALLSERNSIWLQALNNPCIQIAVNQYLKHDDCSIADGDEIAFFPPVTGG